jgi:hypothetical protein
VASTISFKLLYGLAVALKP